VLIWNHSEECPEVKPARLIPRRGIIGTADLADYADISAALQKQILDVFIRFHQREDEAKKED
jgi:hypothetical protein